MIVSVVLPAHNEADNINVMTTQIASTVTDCDQLEIIFVDDGSTDGTFEKIAAAAAADSRVKYVRLARNFGHQSALRAGLSLAHGDCVISMDADQQHPVRLIPEMLAKWRDGYEVVLALRQESRDLSLFKRLTSKAFYWLINLLADVHIDPGSADFRLLDRKVVAVINDLSETDFFLRGIIPWVGFRSCHLSYMPDARQFGSTKYSLRRMLDFAVTGVISCSIRPLRIAMLLSAIVGVSALVYALYAVLLYAFFRQVVPGWSSIIVAISIIGALQLFVLGIIGEYVGRILRETRKRPAFIVAQTNLTEQQDA